jgi:4-hydroxybenzoate polyprenyltransferase
MQAIFPIRSSIRLWLKAIRVHQWLKNFLVFVTLLAAHKVWDTHAAWAAILAFFAFSFGCSAVYIINDLVDLPADRTHPRKKDRPLASGALSVPAAITSIPILLLISAVICLGLPGRFSVVLVGYFFLTCLYSFWLKKQVIVDVMLLASLYTIRILAGAAATSILPSFWLLAFSMFLFLSLALIKRYSEIHALHQETKAQASGRGYYVSDEPILLGLGTAAGYGAVLILALYIDSPDLEGLYPNRWALWLILPPILYWISRVWLKAHRGEVHDDPVIFAVTDKQSWAVVLFLGGVLWLAASH